MNLFSVTNYLTPLTKVLSSATLILGLAGCGSEGQDVGTSIPINQVFSGVAVDGHLARATVFLDSNNNGTRDPWESSAFTDNDGYYSYNPLTGTNYCRDDAPGSEKIYCLTSQRDLKNVVVRVDGGYDILTGEPFAGQLSRRVDLPNNMDDVSNVVSPLTTLMTNIEDTQDRSKVLSSIGVRESDLDIDYLHSGTNNNEINSHLLNTALKIHKTVSLLSDRLEDNYQEIQDEVGTANDPSASVYKNLAQEFVSSNDNSTIDTLLADNSALIRVMDRSETQIRESYDLKDLPLPNDLGNENVPDQLERVVNVATRIPEVVDRLISPLDTQLSNDEAVGLSRVLETVVIKQMNEGANEDPSVSNAINFILDDTQSDLVDTLAQALASDTADVATLTANDFSGEDFDSAEEIAGAAQLPDDAIAFSQIGQRSLRVIDLDLGFGPNQLRDLEIEFYFDGSANDISGSFSSCAKYIEEASSDGSLGEGNTHGEIISGFWSLLGTVGDNRQSYSLLLTFEFLGTTYQAIMKPAGSQQVDGIDYQTLRFDSDGDYRIWHTLDGLTDIDTIPRSNSECQARLPSRVGL